MIKHPIATFALVLAAAACGRAKPATIQPRGHVEPPAFPVDPSQAFQLTDANTNLTFGVNALLWDDPTGEQVRDILDVTRQRRLLAADALNTIKTEIIPAQKAYADLQDLLAHAEDKIDVARHSRDLTAVRTYIHSAADGYIEAQLPALVADHTISAADKVHADLMWQGYCEAKLWELAASPLLNRLYSERPTPLAMCETYYTKQKYFTDAALCGPAATAAGKDYFSCLWHDGVIKSTLFPNPTTGPKCDSIGSLTKGAAIAAWIGADGSGPLRDILRSDAKRDTVTYSNLMRKVVMEGGSIQRPWTTPSNYPVRTPAPFPGLNNCRFAFSRNLPVLPDGRDLDDSGHPYWIQDTPTNLLQIGQENPLQTSGLRYAFVPKPANAAAYGRLGAVVAPFATRAIVNGQLQPSYSDDQLNLVVGEPLLATSLDHRRAVEDGPLLPKLSSFDTPELKELKLKTAPDALVSAKDKLDALIVGFHKGKEAAAAKSVTDAIAVGVVKGASIYINTYAMTVAKTGSELKVTLRFGQFTTQPQIGCLNLETNAPCAVSAKELKPEVKRAAVGFDRASNMISFTFGLGEHPEDVGFPLISRASTGASFNEIPPATLRGKSFQIESYGNQLKDLPIVTGNVYILDSDGVTRLYSGSLTGDAYDQLSAQLFPQR